MSVEKILNTKDHERNGEKQTPEFQETIHAALPVTLAIREKSIPDTARYRNRFLACGARRRLTGARTGPLRCTLGQRSARVSYRELMRESRGIYRSRIKQQFAQGSLY